MVTSFSTNLIDIKIVRIKTVIVVSQKIIHPFLGLVLKGNFLFLGLSAHISSCVLQDFWDENSASQKSQVQTVSYSFLFIFFLVV